MFVIFISLVYLKLFDSSKSDNYIPFEIEGVGDILFVFSIHKVDVLICV
jgi:hypothetical protein